MLDMHMAPMCPVSPRDGLIIRTLLACVTTCKPASPHRNDLTQEKAGEEEEERGAAVRSAY